MLWGITWSALLVFSLCFLVLLSILRILNPFNPFCLSIGCRLILQSFTEFDLSSKSLMLKVDKIGKYLVDKTDQERRFRKMFAPIYIYEWKTVLFVETAYLSHSYLRLTLKYSERRTPGLFWDVQN